MEIVATLHPERKTSIWRWVATIFGINVAILLYGIVRFAAVLMGIDEKQGESLETATSKVGYGLQVEVLHSGTITTLKLKEITSGGSGTLAVVKPEESTSTTPGKGTILASGIGSFASGTNTVTGLSLKVTKGEILWLVFWSETTCKFDRPGGETAFRSASGVFKQNSLALAVSAEWIAEKHGRSRFIAEGTEEEGGETRSLMAMMA